MQQTATNAAWEWLCRAHRCSCGAVCAALDGCPGSQRMGMWRARLPHAQYGDSYGNIFDTPSTALREAWQITCLQQEGHGPRLTRALWIYQGCVGGRCGATERTGQSCPQACTRAREQECCTPPQMPSPRVDGNWCKPRQTASLYTGTRGTRASIRHLLSWPAVHIRRAEAALSVSGSAEFGLRWGHVEPPGCAGECARRKRLAVQQRSGA
jgi:hypothetical protein